MDKNNTFVIEMTDKENLSWHGTITWIQTGEKQDFRSELELLQLIDSACYKKNSEEKS